ncbi:MAG: xanthine dehydrogenase family protein molybdopterin-binding subunit [Burkholderiales bacterium]|nr:xanthine dehydrogenase family protein molybdopterin-binding subunit [Burkholderiales bacterium]
MATLPPRSGRRVSRRFILGSVAAAGGALVLGWGLMPPRQRLVPDAGLAAANGPVPGSGAAAQALALNGWVRISSDNHVTILLARAEMGQGVSTALAMLLADELDADWASVTTEAAPIDPIYNNLATLVDGLPFDPDSTGIVKRVAGWTTAKLMREFGINMTGGSSTIKDLWGPMRQAGASARAMLMSAAAARWSAPLSALRTEAGRVIHSDGRSASYGELVDAAAKLPVPSDVPLKTPAQWRLLGQPLPRRDSAAKSDGSAVFGIDVRLPGMAWASVVMSPQLGGSLLGFDADKVLKDQPGAIKVLAVGAPGSPGARHGAPAGVAVIADNSWRAMLALRMAQSTGAIRWRAPDAVVNSAGGVASAASLTGPAAAPATVHQALAAAIAGPLDEQPGFTFKSVGDVKAAMTGAARRITASYEAPYLAHATLEPPNCTVRVDVDGAGTPTGAEVWVSTQVPDLARSAAAQVLGLKAEQVRVNSLLIGGGFGRRLEVDFITQATEIARGLPGRPVQTVWSREQDIGHDFYRPACVARYEAGLDAQGRLVAWHAVSASQAIVHQVLNRHWGLAGGGPDKTTAEGAFDQAYEFAAARAAHVVVDLPVPVGFWRSVGHSHQAFFQESFVDEVAHAAGVDPLAWRVQLLARHPRELAVLKRCANLAGWGTPLAPAADGAPVARGLALHRSFGSVVAEVVEASLAPPGSGAQRIRVHRVVCVIDCGAVVNPAIVRQQLESSVVFGLSAALYGEITLADGRVQQSNFHDYPVLRLNECPHIETDIISSSAHPEGVGEPGVPPLAPALANAVFALTGQRLRSLPLRLA